MEAKKEKNQRRIMARVKRFRFSSIESEGNDIESLPYKET